MTTKKKPKKRAKPHRKQQKAKKTPVAKAQATESKQTVKPLTKGGKTIRVYGHEVDRNKITNAAIEAYQNKKYTTNDIQIHDYITDTKFHNLMIRIVILDRIEEELARLYPDREIERLNAVTIRIR